jgi:hypothetical protein
MTDVELKNLSECLDKDQVECKKMKAGGPKAETLSSAIGKGLTAGFTLWDLLKAAAVGYATGGLAGAIAAVLALIAGGQTP